MSEVDQLLTDQLSRVGAGDEESFAALYDAASGTAFLLARCLSPHGAEALLHDSFVEVWRRAPRFDPSRERALTWVLAVVRECATRTRTQAVA